MSDSVSASMAVATASSAASSGPFNLISPRQQRPVRTSHCTKNGAHVMDTYKRLSPPRNCNIKHACQQGEQGNFLERPFWRRRGACVNSVIRVVACGVGVQLLGLCPGCYLLTLLGCGAIPRFGWLPWVLLTYFTWVRGDSAIRVFALGAGRFRDSGGCPGCYLLTLLGCGAIPRFGWLPWVRGDSAIRVVALGATYLLYLGAGRLRDSGGCPGCGAIARFGWSLWVRGDCAIRVVALGATYLLYLGAGRLRG